MLNTKKIDKLPVELVCQTCYRTFKELWFRQNHSLRSWFCKQSSAQFAADSPSVYQFLLILQYKLFNLTMDEPSWRFGVRMYTSCPGPSGAHGLFKHFNSRPGWKARGNVGFCKNILFCCCVSSNVYSSTAKQRVAGYLRFWQKQREWKLFNFPNECRKCLK